MISLTRIADMKLISVWNPKGGSGKSTTSLNLAAAAHEIGLISWVVCKDPQGTATDFAEMGKLPFKVISELPKDKPEGVDLIIFDHSAADYETPISPIIVAPIKPCGTDFKAFNKAKVLIKDKIVIQVLNAFDTRRADDKELSKVLRKQGACEVKERSVYLRANSNGVTIFDKFCDKIGGARDARQEFRNILSCVLQACDRQEAA